MRFKTTIVLAAVALTACAAWADSITIPNYSFEDPDVADGANNKSVPSNSNITGWTNLQSPSASGSNHIGVWDPAAGTDPAGLTGEQYARIYMTQVPTGQWLKCTSPILGQTQAGATYTLSTDFMNGSGGGWNVAGELQLWAGGAKVDSVALTTTNVLGTGFNTVSLAGWTADTDGQDIYVQILGQTPAGSPLKLDFDNVQLTVGGLEPPPHPGDANRDGIVDLQDFGILKDNYGTTEGATWDTADFNDDQLVDLQDFGILKDHYGHTAGDVPLTAVPEPVSLGVLLVGAAGLVRRRRR